MTTPTQKRARASAKAEAITTRQEAEQVAISAAALAREMAAVTLRFNERIASLKESAKSELEGLKKRYEDGVKRLQTWAVVNREAEFGEGKTITLAGHELSFQNSPGKVEFERGVNEDAVVQALLKLADDEWADMFLRYSTELNKQAVRDKWESEGPILRNLGLRVTTPELFSFKPDVEKAPESAGIKTGAAEAPLKEAA